MQAPLCVLFNLLCCLTQDTDMHTPLHSLPTGELEETQRDAFLPPSQGPRQYGAAGHRLQLPHPRGRGGGGVCRHDPDAGPHGGQDPPV